MRARCRTGTARGDVWYVIQTEMMWRPARYLKIIKTIVAVERAEYNSGWSIVSPDSVTKGYSIGSNLWRMKTMDEKVDIINTIAFLK